MCGKSYKPGRGSNFKVFNSFADIEALCAASCYQNPAVGDASLNRLLIIMASRTEHTRLRNIFMDDSFFESTWDEFEKAREKMRQESKEMWRKFQKECQQDLTGYKKKENSNTSTISSSCTNSKYEYQRSCEERMSQKNINNKFDNIDGNKKR